VKLVKAGVVVLYISKETVSWEYAALNEAKTESLWCKLLLMVIDLMNWW
jgi:hypothetical protein